MALPETPFRISLRQLDEDGRRPKGSAFRAFRRIESELREGIDFIVLHHADDRKLIDELRAAHRIYASTLNLVLLSETGAQAVTAQMRRMTTEPAE
jgi:hypothetical protein